jgi:1-deoxy-D-xylulose-5-phosphate reductoisomerase
MRKRILLLGSTGSIGKTTLEVVRDFPDRFEIVGLSTHTNLALLAEQIREFHPRVACVSDPAAAARLEGETLEGADVLTDEAGLAALVRAVEADIVVVATVGFAGLFPTLAAIERGSTVALANKEVLVVGGEVVMARAKKAGVQILPIDSEHNAIFQCLAGSRAGEVKRIVLTASGGPFRNWSLSELEGVTPEAALRHPTWNMGRKITIDCATLMNKGLEVIEASHLFGVPPERIGVVVHPQSTVHSMVEFIDGSVLAQMGPTNMYLPILHVLSHPDRAANKFPPLDLAKIGRLDFAEPDFERFPCLAYAYEAIAKGGTMPAALNAANEIAVQAFLEGRIPFLGIPQTIRAAMDAHEIVSQPDVDTLRRVDLRTREWAEEYDRNMV